MMETTSKELCQKTWVAADEEVGGPYLLRVHPRLPAPELTIVIPTLNERENVLPLLERLHQTLKDCDWEVIFVDDNSTDGTADEVRQHGKLDRRIRCLKRINRRGLSGAFIEGALVSQATFVALMDGDLQHDETRLTVMLEKLQSDKMDLVIASRYLTSCAVSGFSEKRATISQWSTWLVNRTLGMIVSDPLSGFFVVRRQIVEDMAPTLKTNGFKILLDILITAKGRLSFAEVPYSFRSRERGESKLDSQIALNFVSYLVNKWSRGLVSEQFLLFGMVGFLGLFCHMGILSLFLRGGLRFEIAQSLTTVMVIIVNFIINNRLTYRDQRLTGKKFWKGLARFEVICSTSLFSNVGIASWFFEVGRGWMLSGLVGACMGAMWNYLLSARYVWQQK